MIEVDNTAAMLSLKSFETIAMVLCNDLLHALDVLGTFLKLASPDSNELLSRDAEVLLGCEEGRLNNIKG